MENLVDCTRCGSNACFVQEVTEDTLGYLCFGCGFTTNTIMVEGSELVDQTYESYPELYKDLKFVDEEGKVWFPSGITLENQGMVFIDGTSKNNYEWKGVLMTPIPEEELSKYPENTTHKVDFSTSKNYGKQDFMDALEYIGFFKLMIQETL